jgi:hypothetical protein
MEKGELPSKLPGVHSHPLMNVPDECHSLMTPKLHAPSFLLMHIPPLAIVNHGTFRLNVPGGSQLRMMPFRVGSISSSFFVPSVFVPSECVCMWSGMCCMRTITNFIIIAL